MRHWCLSLFLMFCGVNAAPAAPMSGITPSALATRIHYSLSRQFVIRETAVPDEGRVFHFAGNTNFVRLTPDLLTVSSERVKKVLLAELGRVDDWKGRIFLDLRPAYDIGEPVNIGSALVGNQRYYRVQLPDVIAKDRLVATLVEVMLREMASRNGTEAVEIPFWLVQGLSWQLIQESPMDLVLAPPTSTVNGLALGNVFRTGRRMDPLADTHSQLLGAAPLNFTDLSWPQASELTGRSAEVYRSTAQLLVAELLRLPDGKIAMNNWLNTLSRQLNWQLSFIAAFHHDFSSQLALEKWWALRQVKFTGHNLTQKWSLADSWKKLDQVLNLGIQVRASQKDLPLHAEIKLARVIRDWELPEQNKVLKEKVRQLFLMRMQVAPEMAQLVEEYRATLEAYRRKSERAAAPPMGKSFDEEDMNTVVVQTLQALDSLESQRQSLRPASASSAPVASNASRN